MTIIMHSHFHPFWPDSQIISIADPVRVTGRFFQLYLPILFSGQVCFWSEQPLLWIGEMNRALFRSIWDEYNRLGNIILANLANFLFLVSKLSFLELLGKGLILEIQVDKSVSTLDYDDKPFFCYFLPFWYFLTTITDVVYLSHITRGARVNWK